jgi:hypothetical protein
MFPFKKRHQSCDALSEWTKVIQAVSEDPALARRLTDLCALDNPLRIETCRKIALNMKSDREDEELISFIAMLTDEVFSTTVGNILNEKC